MKKKERPHYFEGMQINKQGVEVQIKSRGCGGGRLFDT